MKLDKPTPKPRPTRSELFTEALSVSTLAQAERLREKFMAQHYVGRKAWDNFVEHVEAARFSMHKQAALDANHHQ